jgi:hypothetical protein
MVFKSIQRNTGVYHLRQDAKIASIVPKPFVGGNSHSLTPALFFHQQISPAETTKTGSEQE